MLVVLGLVVGLLFVAPALLLWTGRLIMANSDPLSRPRSQRSGRTEASAPSVFGGVHDQENASETSWFRRPMLPAFSKSEVQD